MDDVLVGDSLGVPVDTSVFLFGNMIYGTKELKVVLSNLNGDYTDSVLYYLYRKLDITAVVSDSGSVKTDTTKMFFTRNFTGNYSVLLNNSTVFTTSAENGYITYNFLDLQPGMYTLPTSETWKGSPSRSLHLKLYS